jgi:hypothetical protein
MPGSHRKLKYHARRKEPALISRWPPDISQREITKDLFSITYRICIMLLKIMCGNKSSFIYLFIKRKSFANFLQGFSFFVSSANRRCENNVNTYNSENVKCKHSYKYCPARRNREPKRKHWLYSCCRVISFWWCYLVFCIPFPKLANVCIVKVLLSLVYHIHEGEINLALMSF